MKDIFDKLVKKYGFTQEEVSKECLIVKQC